MGADLKDCLSFSLSCCATYILLRCALIIISKSDYPACNKAHVRERETLKTGLNIHQRAQSRPWVPEHLSNTHPGVLFSHRVVYIRAPAIWWNVQVCWKSWILLADADNGGRRRLCWCNTISWRRSLARIDLVGCYCTSRLTCPCCIHQHKQTHRVLERK